MAGAVSTGVKTRGLELPVADRVPSRAILCVGGVVNVCARLFILCVVVSAVRNRLVMVEKSEEQDRDDGAIARCVARQDGKKRHDEALRRPRMRQMAVCVRRAVRRRDGRQLT